MAFIKILTNIQSLSYYNTVSIIIILSMYLQHLSSLVVFQWLKYTIYKYHDYLTLGSTHFIITEEEPYVNTDT